MESRLPDINTSFNTYRTRAIMAIDSRKDSVCIGALYALNGLLPPEYRIEIDDEIYAQKTKTNLFVVCNGENCKEQFDYNSVNIFEMRTDPQIQLITGIKTRKVWICPKCESENQLTKTKILQTILREPYFLKCVPKPPRRNNLDGKTYWKKFEQWAWTFLDELEERMAQYRDDNWQRGGNELNVISADNDQPSLEEEAIT